MSKRKTKYIDIAASKGAGDYFGTIYDGMAKSAAYQNLSMGARHFYVLCRIQAKSTQGKSCLYKHAAESGTTYNENCFVFPAAHMTLYGLKRNNSTKYINELIKAGFIARKEQNKHRYKINVYEFVSAWKDTS